MSKKFIVLGGLGILAAVVVIGFLAAGPMASLASGAAAGTLKAEMTVGRNLNNIAYNIILKNASSTPVGNIFVSGLVPEGAKFASAGKSPAGATAGQLQGNQVIWIVDKVPAKGQVVLTYNVTATDPAVGANHAWVSWRSPSDGTAMSSDVTADYQLIKVKGVNTRADVEKYPAGKAALTTTSGAGHQEDQIITSGLTNVGVGEYVYLEGAAHDNLENEITTWAWHIFDKPLGSTAALENANQQVARFVPDRAGDYLVHVAATNAKGQSTGSAITITAGKFAGISLCVSCHDGSMPEAPDIMTTFVKTGHADKFETAWPSYSASSDYCIRCHTVGYNEQANAGGMADAARASGWNPKTGSLLAWLKGNFTLEQVKADPNMGRTINIQCENCHGPGATAHTGTKSNDPAVCGQCHPQPMEWKFAGHAKVDAHMATNASCARCHTGQGYVEEWVRGKTLVMADQAAPGKPANVPPIEQQSGISCATCHDPHAADHTFKVGEETKSLQLRLEGEVTAPMGWKVDAGDAATCVRCHSDNRTPQNLKDFVAGTRERGTHENTQADVFYGKGIYDYDGRLVTSNSFHTTFKEACITCHMAPNAVENPGPDGIKGTRDDVKVLSVGGHSWNMKAEWKGKEWENIDACATCHAGTTTFNRPAAGDYDGDGKVEGVQDEVKGLMALLAAQLPRDAEGEVLNYPVTPANSNEAQRKAIWNYNVLKIDGSYGIHNTSFTVQVLQKTYKELTGKDVPGATLR